MVTAEEQFKSRIMAQVEVLVEQALAQGKKRLTLSEIEELALGVRRQVEAEITRALVEQQAAGLATALPTCPDCGQAMHPKGKKRRYLRTRSGELNFERLYFYCATCRQGFFPLDEPLALRHASLSPLLAREAVWLSSLLSYEQAEEVLGRIGGYSLPATTLWEHSQQVGQDWLAEEQNIAVGVERTRWDSRADQPRWRRSVSLDGGMVPIRGEGWKELKVGVVGSFPAPWEVSDQEIPRSRELGYTAVLGGVEVFAAALWPLAVQQQCPTPER